jgi:hypothetical protein
MKRTKIKRSYVQFSKIDKISRPCSHKRNSDRNCFYVFVDYLANLCVFDPICFMLIFERRICLESVSVEFEYTL